MPELREVENLIQKVAWSMNKNADLEWEDLLQEAYTAYLKAIKTYDSDKGKVTTYIFHCVRIHLLQYIDKQKQSEGKIKYSPDLDYFSYSISPEEDLIFKETVCQLSKEAQIICRIIFHRPYIGGFTPKKAKGKLKQLLRRMEWKETDIKKTFTELKKFVNETI